MLEGLSRNMLSGLINFGLVQLFHPIKCSFRLPVITKNKLIMEDSSHLDDIRKTISFLRDNCLNLDDFINLLYDENIFPLVNFVNTFHKEDKRKATHDPQMKHILLTTYYVSRFIEREGLTGSQRSIVIGGALLHDSIEIKRKNNPDFCEKDLYQELILLRLEESDMRKILLISSMFTPKIKPNTMTEKHWVSIKRKDFERLINLNEEDLTMQYKLMFPLGRSLDLKDAKLIIHFIHEIKIADLAANLKETYEDILSGIDGMNSDNHSGLRPLKERVKVFKERVEIIKDLYPDHPLIWSMEMDLSFLQSYVKIGVIDDKERLA